VHHPATSEKFNGMSYNFCFHSTRLIEFRYTSKWYPWSAHFDRKKHWG